MRLIPLRLVLFLGIGGCGGWIFQLLGVPLPWMIGPLVVTAALCLTGLLPTVVPNRIRPFGQVVVASQIGLTFSPATLDKLITLAPVIAATAVMTTACILGVSLALARWNRMGFAQSFLAAVPTSPVEAAAMAVARGVDPVPVIFSQTLRLSAVVLVLPLALFALDGWPAGRVMPGATAAFDPGNMLLLGSCGLAAMFVFRKLRIPNPNFLGPLSVMAALAASGHGFAPYPAPVMAAAQLVLGCWLGSTFRREVIAGAGRMALTSAATTLVLIGCCGGAAVILARITGMDWRLLVLGAAPGGVTEMALTAKFLHQDATIVTAFHLTRIFMVMPNIPWIVALIARLDRPPGP